MADQPTSDARMSSGVIGWLSVACKSVVIPLAVSVGGTWCTNHFQNQTSRDQKLRDAFVSDAMSFNSVIAYYVQEIVSGNPPSQEAVQRIVANINSQFTDLEQARKLLTRADDLQLADRYMQLLVDFREVLPRSKSVLSMATFWEMTSKIALEKDNLIRRLPG